MILVSGASCSGTSLWMRILEAAGFAVLDPELSGEWASPIAATNPSGFHESSLRDGIYYKTNPHPRTGRYLRHDKTHHFAVTVSAQGVVRSDMAFLDRVVLSIRPFRQYVRSVSRRLEQERQAKSEEVGLALPVPPNIAHALRWWDDNLCVLRDSIVRGYPLRAIAHDTALGDADALADTLHWLRAPDVEAGLAQAEPQQGGQSGVWLEERDSFGLPSQATDVFDELYERVRSSRGLDADFIQRTKETDDLLQPQRADARQTALQQRRERAPLLAPASTESR